jgi:exonuclease VII small subunit
MAIDINAYKRNTDKRNKRKFEVVTEVFDNIQKTLNVDDDYDELERLLHGAYEDAAFGKGRVRHHTDGEAFEKQQICEIARRLKGHIAGGPLFQSVKKIYESGRLDLDGAIKELRGSIVYTAAAIKILEEAQDEQEKAISKKSDAEPDYGEDVYPVSKEPRYRFLTDGPVTTKIKGRCKVAK